MSKPEMSQDGQEPADLASRLGLPKIEPGQDVHKLTAAQMFNVPYDQVTPEQRKAAKVVNFWKLYIP